MVVVHDVMMVGPPGAGKTLLARARPGILPRLSMEEALEVTRIYSVADMISEGTLLVRARPFRSPHHTISHAGLVGGGHWPRPGEVSLAHRGVLFLDELPESGTHNLETLRQPIEDHVVTISRASGSLTFPASFMLIAAMNPCPCGYFGDPTHECCRTEVYPPPCALPADDALSTVALRTVALRTVALRTVALSTVAPLPEAHFGALAVLSRSLGQARIDIHVEASP